jgi:hypothetical protein
MFKKLCAAAMLLVVASPAFADHCPRDVKAIDAVLQMGTNLDAEQLAEVKKLRDEGEQLHKDGKHGQSLDVLHQALDMLGMKH